MEFDRNKTEGTKSENQTKLKKFHAADDENPQTDANFRM